MQVPERFEFVCPGECSCVDGTQAAGLDELADCCLGAFVVGCEEDIEWLSGDGPGREGGGERGVEGLDDLRTGSLLGDFGGSRPRFNAERRKRCEVDRVGDVNDGLAGQLIAYRPITSSIAPYGMANTTTSPASALPTAPARTSP